MYRTHEIKVRFSDKEFEKLIKKIAKTGLSREAYIRTLCNGRTPVTVPPADYYSLINEVRNLTEALRQISYKMPQYAEHADRITTLADKLTAITLPQKDTS